MIKPLIFLVVSLMGTLSFSQDWPFIKANQSPALVLTDEFENMYAQPLSTIGWEDGIHISSDGLHLYCTYVPIDILSFTLNNELPNDWSNNYERGAPYFGMDLASNPIGSDEWMQSDILYATRSSRDDPFTSWELSDMARAVYSEGAPSPVFSDASTVDKMLFTGIDNPTNNMDIWMIENTTPNPSGIGAALPAPVNTTLQEDNPNLTRIDADSLVLFYDSEELAGEGGHDIWLSTSGDNGATWSTPVNVSTINTASKEHQPFLYFDDEKGKYLMYYSAYHSDSKLAIFRSEYGGGSSWNNWLTPELVISAGTTAGIGEPTLSTYGDLSFVVVYQDPEINSAYNQFDADPWYLEKKELLSNTDKFEATKIKVYPNPSMSAISFNVNDIMVEKIYILDNLGRIVLTPLSSYMIDIQMLSDGVYFVQLIGHHQTVTTSFIKTSN